MAGQLCAGGEGRGVVLTKGPSPHPSSPDPAHGPRGPGGLEVRDPTLGSSSQVT